MQYSATHVGVFGKDTIYLDECISTNDYAKSLLKSDNLLNGQVIITDYQSKGRGRSGKYWESEPGSNLLFSLVLKPENLEIRHQYYLNLVVSLGIMEAVKEITGAHNFKVKWPNDIYFSDRKISGILIENFLSSGKIDESIIGIGLNVNQHYFNTENASSLYQITRINYNLKEIFSLLMEKLEIEYKYLLNRKLDHIRDRYNSSLYWKDELRLFKTSSQWEGIIRGTDEQGRLLIEKNGNQKHFVMNEISFVR